MIGQSRLRSRADVGAGALVVLAALLACKAKGSGSGSAAPSASERPVTAGAPLELVWEQPYKLVARGTQGEATFFATKDASKPALKLEGAFHGFPAGTRVKLGSEEGTLGESSYWSALVDIKPAVLAQSLEDLKGPIDLGLEVSLTPPGAPTATVKLQKQDVKESLRFALLKARDGGVSFGADDVASGKPRGAAVISGYSDLDFIGSARLVKELDWVVVAEDQVAPRETKSCSFKEGTSTLKIFDAAATAYDRRSGEQVGGQLIRASSECPMIAFIDKQDNSTKSTVAARDVVSWARSALASGPVKPKPPAQQTAHVPPSSENRVAE